MNVVKELIARIEDSRLENKNPCKSYATEAAAEKATAHMALQAGEYFTQIGKEPKSARYIVVFIESWGRWVGGIDLSELLNRPTSTGGYLGFCKGFYSY